MTFTKMPRGRVRARGSDHGIPLDVSRRIAQQGRRLDEHRSRIEYVERGLDDGATEIVQLASRLAAVERRLVELQVAADHASATKRPAAPGSGRSAVPD